MDISIEKAVLTEDLPNYQGLVELQRQAKQAVRQAEQLKKWKPQYARRYAKQLRDCLAAINEQADKLLRA